MKKFRNRTPRALTYINVIRMVPATECLALRDRGAVTKIMSPEELEQELRAIGAERYHDKHLFHVACWQAKQKPGAGLGAQPLLLSGALPRKDA